MKKLFISLPPYRRWLAGLTQERDLAQYRLAAAEKELEKQRTQWKWMTEQIERIGSEPIWAPSGHFHSPIPALSDVKASLDEIFQIPNGVRGVDLNDQRQQELLNLFAEFYAEQPFSEHKSSNRRYYFDNPNYAYGDGITLYGMIRHLKPKRIIEVGSGFSSAAMLDVNELFFDNSIACTFVEPRPQLLQSLLKEGDRSRIRLLPYTVQDVDPRVFRELEASDILFIDSSHVSKTGSDVNCILFNILPILNSGVHVHFHDIFYPFEYPSVWVYENRAWNEAYLLRAFLQYNRTFEVEFFSNYMVHKHLQVFESRMPHFLKNPGGNIWLKKTQLDSKLDRIDEKIERTKPVPRSLAPALAENRWLMDEGWHWGEEQYCWMAGRASVRLAGPDNPSQQLRIRGYSPHEEGAQLAVTVDEFVLPALKCRRDGPINASFSLPAVLVGRPEIRVQLDMDRTLTAPNDPRIFGFRVEEIEVR